MIGHCRPTRSSRSRFDAWRWKCANTGADICGVWMSAIGRDEAHKALTAHAVREHGYAPSR